MNPEGIDRARIEKAVREILEALGEDPDRDGLLATPGRVADMYAEVFSGLHEDPDQVLDVTFESGHDEMVGLRDIPLFSWCEHHLVPFVGRAHVVYIPNTDGRITGLSKLVRVVSVHAARPRVQESLTTDIADSIERVLQPRGVMVALEAEHFCMSVRGVNRPGITTFTSAVRGLFRDDPRTRAEGMAFIQPR